MFEVKLKCEYEDIQKYRDAVRSNLSYVSRSNSPIRSSHRHSN
jgi:hypothetical protein